MRKMRSVGLWPLCYCRSTPTWPAVQKLGVLRHRIDLPGFADYTPEPESLSRLVAKTWNRLLESRKPV